jgi:hypothetical protein
MRAGALLGSALVLMAAGCQVFEPAPVADAPLVAQQQPQVMIDPAVEPAQYGSAGQPAFVPMAPVPTVPVAPMPVAPVPVAPPANAVLLQPQIAPATGTVAANPIFIPVTNQDWAWEQIVDVVDDYFRVERESRVQLVGNVVTEGRIDTFPQVGATFVEPHRPDSVGNFNRLESTFQTIRRRAIVRVIPEQGGYMVDLTVEKELEDLPHPENATAGGATFRNDSSLVSDVNEEVSRTRLSQHWIPLGRDTECEQQILAEIQARLGAGGVGNVLLR